MSKIYKYFFIAAVLCFIPMLTQAAPMGDRDPLIKVYNSDDLTIDKVFHAFHESFKGGARVAVGDINGDGFNEIVTGAGPGGGPQIRLWTGKGYPLGSFMAYASSFSKGVNVATGDLDGDGAEEIIVGAGNGGGPQVRIFDDQGNLKFTSGFFAYATNFRGGVQVAAGDIDGDGNAEIVTGPGPSGGPHVRVFNKDGDYIGIDIIPFRSEDRGGVSVATANVDGGAEEEIIVGIHKFGRAWVKVYKADVNDTIVSEFVAWPESLFKGGVNVTGADVDQDGYDEIVVGVNSAGGPQVKMFEAHGDEIAGKSFFAYEDKFRGGVKIAAGDVDADGIDEVITAPGRLIAQGRTDMYKYIEVNLSEQKLYTYENGFLVKSFLISSGTSKYPTPSGNFSVRSKVISTRMRWEYGPNHPDNYDLANVPHVLSFYGAYTLHGAYWHNNFGHRMSHGCVNISLSDAAWLYGWASVGTPVIVHY